MYYAILPNTPDAHYIVQGTRIVAFLWTPVPQVKLSPMLFYYANATVAEATPSHLPRSHVC